MARARNIKPGFFQNELLADLPPLARILFAGLWTLADRAGRLEDRPKKIRAQVLPYDDCDCNELLQSLHNAGFVQRYIVGDASYIQIVTWEKHQNPHVREPESCIPDQDKNSSSTVKAPDKNSSSTSSARLIPSSSSPDSSSPDSSSPDSSSPDSSSTVEITDHCLDRESGSRNIEKNAESTPPLRAGQAQLPDPEPKRRPPIGTRLPEDWALPKAWGDWALQQQPTWTPDRVRQAADAFRDHWIANANRKEGRKADWFATWRNWVRREKPSNVSAGPPGATLYEQNRAAMAAARSELFPEHYPQGVTHDA